MMATLASVERGEYALVKVIPHLNLILDVSLLNIKLVGWRASYMITAFRFN